MSYKQLIVWFVDECFAPELESAVSNALGEPREWAAWELFDAVSVARDELQAIEQAADFPDVVLIRAREVEAAGVLLRTLRSRCEVSGKSERAYLLVGGSGEARSEDVTIPVLLRQAEDACSEAARHRLANGVGALPAGISALLWNSARAINSALEERRSAEKRFAKDARPALLKIADSIEQVAALQSHHIARELRAADTPIVAELAMHSCRRMLDRRTLDDLRDVLAKTKGWWEHAENAICGIVADVWRELDCDDAFGDLWQLVPFAGRRLWRGRNSVATAERTLDDLNSVCRLLEDSIDYTMALTRLFKAVDFDGRTVPTRVFAHMLHSWNRRSEFKTQFGFELPQEHSELEDLLRAELDGLQNGEVLRVSRVNLPPQTIDNIKNDARARSGGIGGPALLKFAVADDPLADWLVAPAVYLSESMEWTDIVRCPVEVVRDIENVEKVPKEKVLADWRHLRNLIKLLMDEVKGKPLATKILYSPDAKYVTLDFDFSVAKHLGKPELNMGTGDGKQAVRDLRPWCQDVRLRTNDKTGQCYEAAGPSFVPKEIGSRRLDPFMKLSLSIPHYNHTRGAD